MSLRGITGGVGSYDTPPFMPPPGTNGPAVDPTGAPPQRGFAGFFDRFMSPTNGLGQFGRALVMAGGTPLGAAYSLMDKQKAEGLAQTEARRKAAIPKTTQIGNQFGIVDDNGMFRPTYTAPQAEDSVIAGARAAGATDEQIRQYQLGRLDPVKTAVQQNPDGTMTLVPYRASQFGSGGGGGGASSALGAPEVARARHPGALAPGVMDAITAQAESGNRDYRNGSAVVSPKGARFAMQVMPATARDPGFGLRPADPNDPADMNRLGREYRGAMERRYDGDPEKMWAAYNAGPGRVDAALRRPDWLGSLPAETRNFVAKNVAALNRTSRGTTNAPAPNRTALVRDAQAAIARGADPAKVYARLKQLGAE